MGLLGIGYAVSHDLRLALCIFVAAVLGATGRRVVGGFVGDVTGWAPPHLLACGFFAACIAASAWLGGATWWAAATCGAGAWAGHVALGLWSSAAMGRYGDRNEMWRFWGIGCWISAVDGRQHSKPGFILSWMGMTGYGISCAALTIAVAICPLVNATWWIPILGACLWAPIYAATNKIFDMRPIGWPRGLGPPLAMGELLGGSALGASVYLCFALS